MAALIQTIAVVDKSGKAVSTSKHLVNVFKEAKAAYRERKAEVTAGRRYEIEENKARRVLQAATIQHDRSATSSRRHSRTHHGGRRHHSEYHRHSASSTRSDPVSPNTIYPSSQNSLPQESDVPPPEPRTQRRSSAQQPSLELTRPRPLPARSLTTPITPASDPIDMNLAYGPLPPPLPLAHHASEQELTTLVSTVKRLLEEAECLHYTATATIASLQRNPDAMAAVALTLAEISNIATRMAPGVLASLKGSAPAVFALLASPQFLIAGGVAVGVTIVALGGYKIIKKIKAKSAVEEPGVDEMLAFGSDVGSIETWRRGVEVGGEEMNSGTSVDGEFITPQAAALSRLNLNEQVEERRRGPTRSRTWSEGEGGAGERARSGRTASQLSERPGSGGRRRSERGSERGSERKSESESGSKRSGKSEKDEKKAKKVKKPSPLRLMFT